MEQRSAFMCAEPSEAKTRSLVVTMGRYPVADFTEDLGASVQVSGLIGSSGPASQGWCCRPPARSEPAQTEKVIGALPRVKRLPM